MQRMAYTISNNPHIIDTMRNRELNTHLNKESDQTKYCVHCGEPIGPNTDNYVLDDELYCVRCDYAMRDRVNNFLADLLGYHVSDEALDAIMAECEREGY